MSQLCFYRRQAAVNYAHQWAYSRNPAYADFQDMGGDCTNFASQCLYAGIGLMNFTPIFGWYYRSLRDRAPAWTGVSYFFQFVTRAQQTPGPVAELAELKDCLPGDFIQLSFDGQNYTHTLIIVETDYPASLETTLVAAHTNNVDYRPLSRYSYKNIRFLHVLGGYC